ncbi:Nuclear pore complex protein Nup155 [Strongyloides ratti]|uniref:Nuclear pore complex protein Nup155 n=1 Tax=Strongyloides ratti TaxID=34506 RepID=A0A090LG40_STRRB|nr:Nuclear pore complex protein Nup155 [Strongyloides ratti]CEF68746.1 Nuclear pore complex protein Nup155 [Strongyloides ratti]
MNPDVSGYLGNDEFENRSFVANNSEKINIGLSNPEKDLVSDILLSDRAGSDFFSVLKLQNSFNPNGFLTTVSGARDEDYCCLEDHDINELRDLKCTSIPEELKDQFHGSTGISNYGTFPIISRSWMSIDNEFFIWQDETRSDMAMFPMTSIIHLAKVGIVGSGLFKNDEFPYILVLITAKEAVIIPLKFESPNHLPITDYKKAMLYFGAEAKLCVSLGGEKINDFVITNEGRILMISGNSLLEIEYRTKGWFGGRQAKLINHSKSFLSFLVPSIPFLSSTDEYIKITVDNSRGIIHILSSMGNILVYLLSNDGKTITEIGEITNERVVYLAGRFCKVHEMLFQNIVCIVPIESWVSQFISFMAVTALGTRLYFGLQMDQPKRFLNDGLRVDSNYNAIVLAHIRLEPQNEKFSHLLPASRCVYNAIITKESTIVCYGRDNHCTDSFVVVYSNVHFPLHSPLLENFQVVRFKGVVWDMEETTRSELTSRVNRSLPYIIPKTIVPITFMTDEHLLTYRYKIVTATTISTFEQVSPLSTLQNFIQVEEFDSKKFEQFVAIHGRINILSMTLQIICSDASRNNMIKTNAKKLFAMMHGEPLLVHEKISRPSFVTRSVPSQSQALIPNQQVEFHASQSFKKSEILDSGFGTSNVIYSTAHDASYTFFSRVISSLWVSELVVVKKQKDSEYYSTIDNEQAMRIIRQLTAFLREIETAPSFLRNFKPLDVLRDATDHFSKQNLGSQSVSEKNFAKQRERESMVNFVSMVSNTVELLQLWSIFVKIKSKFCELLFENEIIIKKMVRGLIRMHLKDNASVTGISSDLRKLCPTLFSNDDYKLLKAEEILKEANEAVNIEAKEYLVQDATKILLSVSDQVDISKCVEFLVGLRFYKHAVQFCIRLGEKFDQGHLSDMYIEQPKSALSNERVAHAVEKVRLCYSSISYVLLELGKEIKNKSNKLATEDLRQDIIAIILRSASKTGLYKIYEDAVLEDDKFLMKYFSINDFRDYLLWYIRQKDCPSHFEKLVDVQRSSTNGHEYMAELLYQKALDQKLAVDMDTRIFWLSQAVVFIQSGKGSAGQTKNMLAIKEALECAEVQNFVAKELELYISSTATKVTDNFDHEELNYGKQLLHELRKHIWRLNDVIEKVVNEFNIPLANLVIYKTVIGGNISGEDICNLWDAIIENALMFYKMKKENVDQVCNRLLSIFKRIETAPSINSASIPKKHIIIRLLDFFMISGMDFSDVISFCHNSILSLDSLVEGIDHLLRYEKYDNQEDVPMLKYLVGIIVELSKNIADGKLRLPVERCQKLKRKLLDAHGSSQLLFQRLDIEDFENYSISSLFKYN